MDSSNIHSAVTKFQQSTFRECPATHSQQISFDVIMNQIDALPPFPVVKTLLGDLEAKRIQSVFPRNALNDCFHCWSDWSEKMS